MHASSREVHLISSSEMCVSSLRGRARLTRCSETDTRRGRRKCACMSQRLAHGMYKSQGNDQDKAWMQDKYKSQVHVYGKTSACKTSAYIGKTSACIWQDKAGRHPRAQALLLQLCTRAGIPQAPLFDMRRHLPSTSAPRCVGHVHMSSLLCQELKAPEKALQHCCRRSRGAVEMPHARRSLVIIHSMSRTNLLRQQFS